VGKRRITEEKERSAKVNGGSTTIDREGVRLHIQEGTRQFCSTCQSAAEKEVATTNNDSRGMKSVM